MNQNGLALAGYDPWVFAQNRTRYTGAMLAAYEGEWVAWSLDALHILGHHADPLELARMLDRAGIARDQFTTEYISRADEADAQL